MRHVRALRRRLVPLVAVVALVTACTEDPDPAPEPPPPTPVGEIDLSGVTFPRSPFCDALAPDAVAEALGGEPTGTDHYRSGDRRELSAGLVDVAHEDNCTWHRGSGPTRTTARAWVFVAPATPRQARGWLRERAAREGCSPAGELEFGRPGSVLSCDEGARRRVTLAGLVGDAWLTCELKTPARGDRSAAEVVEAAERFCARVATSR